MKRLRGTGLIWMLCLSALPAAVAAGEHTGSQSLAVAFGPAVSEEALGSVRGRDGSPLAPGSSQLSQSSLGATLTGNTLTSGTTGTNLSGDGVFSGASGIATMIQNSGNQVIIQNNVTVNLNLR